MMAPPEPRGGSLLWNGARAWSHRPRRPHSLVFVAHVCPQHLFLTGIICYSLGICATSPSCVSTRPQRPRSHDASPDVPSTRGGLRADLGSSPRICGLIRLVAWPGTGGVHEESVFSTASPSDDGGWTWRWPPPHKVGGVRWVGARAGVRPRLLAPRPFSNQTKSWRSMASVANPPFRCGTRRSGANGRGDVLTMGGTRHADDCGRRDVVGRAGGR